MTIKQHNTLPFHSKIDVTLCLIKQRSFDAVLEDEKQTLIKGEQISQESFQVLQIFKAFCIIHFLNLIVAVVHHTVISFKFH